MPIDKITPRYLNIDDDYLLVKSTEMIDALNVHVSDDSDGNAGVIKNAWGNSAVSFASGSSLPAGTNRVVGTYVNTQKSELFFFVYNSNGDHSVYVYTEESGEIKLVYRDSVLGFTIDSYVDASSIVKESGDTLLYFTDSVNYPMKINVTRALLGTGYPYKLIGVTNYNDEEKLFSITTAKQPPLSPPTFSFVHDQNIEFSNITNQTFQFAAQYIYEDGEVSAISPYSELAINPIQFFDGYVDKDSLNYYNKVQVSVPTSLGDVSKIRVLFRRNNTTTFYVLGEKNNSRGGGNVVFDFANEKNYNIVAPSDVNKMYDNVPKTANSVVVANNRLVYGGYNEFYDNVSVTSSKYPIYHPQGKIGKISFAPTTAATLAYNNVIVEMSFAQLPKLTTGPSLAVFYINAQATKVTVTGPNGATMDLGDDATNYLELGFPEVLIEKPVQLNAYTNHAGIGNQIVSALSGDYTVAIKPTVGTTMASQDVHYFAGEMVVNLGQAVVDSVNRKVTFKLSIKDVNIKTSRGLDYDGAAIPETSYINEKLTNINASGYGSSWVGYKIQKYYSGSHFYSASNKSFKSGATHKFGVVFYDDRNRSGAVNEIGETYIQRLGERSNGNYGPVEMAFRMVGSPPSWAKKWQLVYSPMSSYSFAYQYSVAEAFISKVTETATNDRKIYLALRTIEGKETSYKESKGAIFDYSFVEGDIIRVIKYESGSLPNGNNQYPQDLTFKVLGYNYQATPDDPIVSSPHDEYRETGWFLEIKDENYGGWNSSDIDSNTDLWHHDVIIEIYRQRKESDVSIYYEIGEVHDVIYDQFNQVYRYGGDRDYTYTWSSGTSNITVSQGVATSTLDLREGDLIDISNADQSRVYNNLRIINVVSTPTGVQFDLDGVADDSYSLASIDNLTDGVVQTFAGDVYYRPRQIKVNPNGDKTNKTGILYEDFFIEDNSVSDFFSSKANNSGRPNAVAENAGSIYRQATITYSEPYSLDSQTLTLSSFNLSQANFVDMQPVHGAIKKLLSMGDSMLILQERKASMAPMSRNLIEYVNGGAGVTVSSEFIGPQSFYGGDYGINDNPESVISVFGNTYFVDVRQGKVIRLSANGIEPISEQGIDSFMTTKCSEVVSIGTGNFKIHGGYDPQHKEYLVTFEKYKGAGVFTNETIAYDTKSSVWNTRYSFIPESYAYMNNQMFTYKCASSNAMWSHNEDVARNTFYGTAYSTKVNVVSAPNNSMVKTFEAASIEGNSPWSFVAKTSDQVATTVSSSDMEKRERMYYSAIPRDTQISTAHIYPLGAVDEYATGSVSFTTKISDIPFPLGGTLYILDSGAYVSTGLSVSSVTGRKSISTTGTLSGTINPANELAVYGNSSVDGDVMRDAFVIMEFTNSSTTPIEAYAFNTYYNRSMLHNELVN